MSTAAGSAGYADRTTPAAGSAPAPAQVQTRPGWMLGPWADLLFVANIAWPAVAVFAAMFVDTPASEAFGFLLAFFVIMPHRWITLPLVFCDRQKFADRPLAYLAVLGFVIMLCSTIRLSMESLALLVAIDYVWNAWHFSAQHSGILGIYARLARPEGGGATKFEKYGLRVFFMYTLLRLTGMFAPEGSVPFLDWVHDMMRYVAWCDFAVAAIPLGLLVREAIRFERRALGRMVYMTSISCVYLGLLAGIRYELTGLIVGCAAATTLIHSSEYLSIVSWHVPKSRSLSQSAIFARLIPHWALFLFSFMAFFALTAFFFRERYVEEWIWINLNVSLLHYAYDGMIWKRPKKKAA